MFKLRKHRRVKFCGTEIWCKIWRKTDLFFQKWHEEVSKFSQEHSKVSKLGLWWNSFIQSRKCISLKFIMDLCIMIINDAKIWMMQNLKRHWPVSSKLTWEIWWILIWAHETSKMFTLMGCFWLKYLMFELKKYRGVIYVWWHWRLMQNLKENLLVLSKRTWRICQIFTGNKWRFHYVQKSGKIKIKIKNNQMDLMQCENFILPWK